MGIVSHSHHGLDKDGGSWYLAYGAQPRAISLTAEYARALTVCEVGTPLSHNGTNAVTNHYVTE